MRQDIATCSVLILAGALVLSGAYAWGQAKSTTAEPGASEPSKGKSGAEAGKDSEKGMASRGGRGSENVKKAQEALKSKGHDPGPIDGVAGPKTREAIKAFQSAGGMKATGRLDAETAKALGVEGASSSEKKSTSKKSSSKEPTSKEPAPETK